MSATRCASTRVKFFADGGLSGATAAISQPYKITGDHGVLRFETEELIELMWEAHDAGFRIGTHAIGDVALDQVIGVYEILHQRKPGTGCATASSISACRAPIICGGSRRLTRLPCRRPFFSRRSALLSGAICRTTISPRCYPVRAMIDAGLTVALSSDAPVVPDDNPLLGIKAALDRLDGHGDPIAPEQAITRLRGALRLHDGRRNRQRRLGQSRQYRGGQMG